MTSRRVLISGGCGLCGSEMLKHFRSLGDWDVWSVDRKSANVPQSVCFDLCEPVSPGENGFPDEIDAVVHTAASLDQHTTNFSVIDANVRSTFNMVEYARKAGCFSLVNLSSSAVYGLDSPTKPWRETDVAVPTTNYGLSKLLGEQVAASAGRAIKVSHLRLGFVLGQQAPRHGLIARLKDALDSDAPITLENPDETTFQFIDARDIAEVCRRIIEEGFSGTYNVAANEGTTLRQVYDIIRDAVPQSSSPVTVFDAPERVLRTSMATDELRTRIGGITFRPVAESINCVLDRLKRAG